VNARARRHVHLAVLFIWLGPGLVACWFWAHSIAWIVFMSWFANCYSVASAYSAETPVEEEK
jgi:hypothetical protein